MLKKWILVLPSCFASLVCQASMLDFYVAGGPTISKLSNENLVQINSSVTNAYDSDNNSSLGPLVGVGFGHTFDSIFNRPFNISVALMGYYSYYNDISGIEHPFVNVGQFDTLNYQFNAENYSAMLEFRLANTTYSWRPFLLLGLGEGWNRLFDYSETPTNPSGTAAPVPFGYQSKTTNAFAYEVGVGVQHDLYYDAKYKIQWLAALDYRYMNFGQAKLGGFPALTSGDTLQINHLTTQAIVVSLQASVV
jgi:opacity protein-like surface antigen